MNYINHLMNILNLVWLKNIKVRILMLSSLAIVYLAAVGQSFVPLIFKHIVDSLSSSRQEITSSSLFGWLLISYGISWTLCQLLPAFRIRLTFRVIEYILIDIISHTINKFIDLDFLSNSKKKTGELIAIIERTQQGIPTLLDGVFVQVIPTILQILVASIIITINFGLVYSLLLILIIILYCILSKLSLDKSIQLRTENNRDINNYTNYIMDTLQHYDTIKYFANENFEKQKVYELLNKKKASTFLIYTKESNFAALQVIIVGAGLTLISYISGQAVLSHKMTVGGFVLLNSYIMQFSLPLSYLGYVFQAIKRSFVDLKEFIEYTSFKVEHSNSNEVILNNLVIEFKNVSFTYENGKPILKDISFVIEEGEKLVILGKTGAGKSTLIKLILGLIKPTTGEILLGGININNIPAAQLMSIFGIIPQDCALFNRTILENIKYGNLNTSNQEIEKIMQLLHLEHLDPMEIVGERSIKVSGGERQRIAIARLLLRNCQICIFDEFTSSLDLNTEKEVLQLVDTLFNTKTRIIISHKLNLIKNDDKVLILNNGMIEAYDTHANLLAINPE